LHGSRLVVCLRRGDAERDAALHWFEVDWNDFWRFAAVRKSLDTSKPEISCEPRILSLEKKMEKLTEKWEILNKINNDNTFKAISDQKKEILYWFMENTLEYYGKWELRDYDGNQSLYDNAKKIISRIK
jgi:hypothetical protein